jgi:hypothetical protein
MLVSACKEAGFTLYVVTIIEIYSVKPDQREARGQVLALHGPGRLDEGAALSRPPYA